MGAYMQRFIGFLLSMWIVLVVFGGLIAALPSYAGDGAGSGADDAGLNRLAPLTGLAGRPACFVELERVGRALRAFADSQRRGCVTDSDCVLVEASVGPFSGCPTAISAARAGQFSSRLRAELGMALDGGVPQCTMSTQCQMPIGTKCDEGVCAESFPPMDQVGGGLSGVGVGGGMDAG
jgi:hypothetical protein